MYFLFDSFEYLNATQQSFSMAGLQGRSSLRNKAVKYVAPNDNVIVTANSDEINNADKIIFPGQGAAKRCMQSIYDQNLDQAIKNGDISKV